MERQKVGERAERRPAEVENEPEHEEDEREDQEPGSDDECGDDPDREQRGKHRKATVVQEIPGNEPAEDGRRAEGVVLRAIEIWAHIQVPGLREEREPHKGGDYTGERADRAKAQDTAERVRARQPE